jgi:hypothetical protein
MNRKLILLNVVLAGLIVFAGVKWREQYQAEKAREAALRSATVKPVPPPAFYPLPNDPPAMPVAYKEVALKTLFHPSRDPNEIVEPPPPPPPPPPMPELPRYHGQMNLGDGPEVIMVEHPGSAEKVMKPGDSIGQFKLVDVNTSEITFEWKYNGSTVRRTLSQLLDRSSAPAAAEARPQNNGQPAAAPAAPVVMSNKGAGEATQFGFKTCLPDDSSPEGTVDKGFRKVITQTPFGKSCKWDPVSGR